MPTIRVLRLLSLATLGLPLLGGPVLAQQADTAAAEDAQTGSPAPVSDVVARDRPNDAGDGILVTWTLSPDDVAEAQPRRVIRYEIERLVESVSDEETSGPDTEESEPGAETSEPDDEIAELDAKPEYESVGETTYQVAKFEDANAELGKTYLYRVIAIGPDGSRSQPADAAAALQTIMQYYDKTRSWYGVMLLLLGGTIVYFIGVARKGGDIWVRPIPGLEAVSEAVGRATEMGRSCLFVPGIQDINDIQTVAGITVLSRVAKLTAEYDAHLWVPTSRSLVMTTARETVESSYLGAGRPDAYREDDIFYLTDEQFGFVAGVTGQMLRERPAACFYMGAFYAESLLLAETGNQIGAIQIAGTAMPAQLPFFVAACDYTLIGEEFFAASAYLSGEPQQLGSLKGQDLGKLVGAVLLIAGCTFATLHAVTGSGAFELVTNFVTNNVLGRAGFLP